MLVNSRTAGPTADYLSSIHTVATNYCAVQTTVHIVYTLLPPSPFPPFVQSSLGSQHPKWINHKTLLGGTEETRERGGGGTGLSGPGIMLIYITYFCNFI